ncbi:MAG TPA: fatty acid desaturase [Tepidisphaeraceae bacterium]|jgi:fatty acid desaturase
MTEQIRKGRQIDWYRTPIDKELLKRLSGRSDLLGFRQTLGFLGLYALTAGLALYSFGHWHWAATVLLVFAHGIVASFLGGCGIHELSHNTVFRTRWLNQFFSWVISLLSWWSHIGFQVSHLRHHAYTLHPPDDLEVVLPAKMPSTAWAWFTICVFNPIGLRDTVKNTWKTAAGRLEGEWMPKILPESDPKRRRLTNWARAMLAFHTLLLATSVTLAVVLKMWALLLLPVLISCGPFFGGWLVFLCGMPQHFGLMDNVPDFRLSCRTYTTNPLFGLLYWQMQYHTDHHMYPTVPCYHLKKLHAAIKHDLPPTPHGLIACWREMREINAKQREDPTYQYRAPIPEPVAAA